MASSNPHPIPLALGAVQSRCTSLQNLAHRAIAKHATEPAAGLGGSIVCTTTRFCTKKGRKARRREGDKCFFRCVFLLPAISQPVSHWGGRNHDWQRTADSVEKIGSGFHIPWSRSWRDSAQESVTTAMTFKT